MLKEATERQNRGISPFYFIFALCAMQYDLRAAIDVKKIWEFGCDDVGCVSMFRANTEESFGVLGDIVENGSVSMPTVMIPSFSVCSDAFAHPHCFQMLWASETCSLWRAVPPENFVVCIFAYASFP